MFMIPGGLTRWGFSDETFEKHRNHAFIFERAPIQAILPRRGLLRLRWARVVAAGVWAIVGYSAQIRHCASQGASRSCRCCRRRRIISPWGCRVHGEPRIRAGDDASKHDSPVRRHGPVGNEPLGPNGQKSVALDKKQPQILPLTRLYRTKHALNRGDLRPDRPFGFATPCPGALRGGMGRL